jgi:hypothetical protein
MKFVVRFRDVLSGPPTSWVPPGVYPFPNPALNKLEPPIPSGKGRGGCNGVGVSERVQAFQLKPTSLERGEGLSAGL